MPDLQTEIFTKVLPNLSAIKFDDGDEPEITMPEVTFAQEAKEPLIRRVFKFINANPKVQGKKVMDEFEDLGYSRSVVASTTCALINDKRVVRVGGKLSTTRDSYEKPKVAKVTTLPKKVVQNKISEYEREAPKKEVFDVDILLGTLSMYQGRELYNRLKAIYGG